MTIWQTQWQSDKQNVDQTKQTQNVDQTTQTQNVDQTHRNCGEKEKQIACKMVHQQCWDVPTWPNTTQWQPNIDQKCDEMTIKSTHKMTIRQTQWQSDKHKMSIKQNKHKISTKQNKHKMFTKHTESVDQPHQVANERQQVDNDKHQMEHTKMSTTHTKMSTTHTKMLMFAHKQIPQHTPKCW